MYLILSQENGEREEESTKESNGHYQTDAEEKTLRDLKDKVSN